MCFFPRILESLPPLPRQNSAAIGCTKIYQPIGVTVHSHCVESFEGLLQRCWRGRSSSELWKKHNFYWTPCTRLPCLVSVWPGWRLSLVASEVDSSIVRLRHGTNCYIDSYIIVYIVLGIENMYWTILNPCSVYDCLFIQGYNGSLM